MVSKTILEEFRSKVAEQEECKILLRLENSFKHKRRDSKRREKVFRIIYKTREQFYTGSAWRRVSKEYARSKKFLCERCLKKGLVVPYEEVHHKKRLNLGNINNPEISLNWENLECLCKKCHEAEHEQDARERFKNREAYKKKHAQEKKRYLVDQETGKVICFPES